MNKKTSKQEMLDAALADTVIEGQIMLTLNNSGIENPQQEFLSVHNEIITYGNMAYEFMGKMAECLKKMRDEKLYIAAGIETFGEYAEKMVGIKERQAYNYITAYEGLPKDFLHLNAKIGVTKLLLLAGASEEIRATVSDNFDLDNTTVKELKAEIDRLTGKNKELEKKINMQQIPLMPETVEQKPIKEIEAEIRRDLEQEYLEKLAAVQETYAENFDEESLRVQIIDELGKNIRQEIEEMNNRKLDEFKEKAEAAKKANKEAADKLKAAEDKAKAAAEAEKKAKADAEAARKEAAEATALRAELDAAKAKAEAMERQIRGSANPEYTRFKYTFEEAQLKLNLMLAQYKKLDDETKNKVTPAINAMIGGIQL